MKTILVKQSFRRISNVKKSKNSEECNGFTVICFISVYTNYTSAPIYTSIYFSDNKFSLVGILFEEYFK